MLLSETLQALEKGNVSFIQLIGKWDTQGLQVFPKLLWMPSWLLMSLKGVSVSPTSVRNSSCYSPLNCHGDFKAEKNLVSYGENCYRVFLASFSVLVLCKDFASTLIFL